MKLLAVDDDPLILNLLVATLAANGYEDVATAGSADEAARLISAASQPFDGFLLDIIMPEVDGIELCRWIRSCDLYRATPILMVTAMSEMRFINRAFRAGAWDYVTKPFEAVELITRLRLAQHGAGRRAQHGAGRGPDRDADTLSEAEQYIGDGAQAAPAGDQQSFALADAVALDPVEGLIGFVALQNYLLQLSRGSFYATSVIALQIQEADSLHELCAPDRFRSLLRDVAGAAISALKGSDCILSYAGNGAFVGVLGFAGTRDFNEVELMINLMIDRLRLTDATRRPLDIRVTVGAPHPVGVLKTGRVAVALLRRAIRQIPVAPRAHQAPGVSGASVLLKALARVG